MNTGLGIFGFTNPGTFEDNSVLTGKHVQCSKLKANLFSEQNGFLVGLGEWIFWWGFSVVFLILTICV